MILYEDTGSHIEDTRSHKTLLCLGWYQPSLCDALPQGCRNGRQKNYPDYVTKLKSEWVKLDNVKMFQEGFTMDRKTKTKALRKLEKEKMVQVEWGTGKAPQVRLRLQ